MVCIEILCVVGKENDTTITYERKVLLAARHKYSSILGLQPRDKAAMLVVLVVNAIERLLEEFRRKWSLVPRGEKCFVLDQQHGRRDVTCKPAIRYFCRVRQVKRPLK